MKQKRFNVEQIVAVLKQAEAGVPLAELIGQVRIPNRRTIDGRSNMSDWRSTRFVSSSNFRKRTLG